MFPDMYLQYNHPTIKSQQKPFDKNRQNLIPLHPPQRRCHTPPTTHPPQRRCHLPAHHKETQPLQPSSAALMAHHLPSDHHTSHLQKTRTDRLPAGRLHGRRLRRLVCPGETTAPGTTMQPPRWQSVRSSLHSSLPHTKKEPPGPNTQELSQNSNIQLPSIVISHHPTRSRNF